MSRSLMSKTSSPLRSPVGDCASVSPAATGSNPAGKYGPLVVRRLRVKIVGEQETWQCGEFQVGEAEIGPLEFGVLRFDTQIDGVSEVCPT